MSSVHARVRACVSVVPLALPQVYGYPWYTDVRKTLEDPAYAVSPQRLFDCRKWARCGLTLPRAFFHAR